MFQLMIGGGGERPLVLGKFDELRALVCTEGFLESADRWPTAHNPPPWDGALLVDPMVGGGDFLFLIHFEETAVLPELT